MTAQVTKKILTLKTLNPKLLKAQYAVRGELAIRSEQIQNEMHSGKNFPFSSITSCNIGNPQQLRQKPITFFRQVAALMEYPELLAAAQSNSDGALATLFPTDAIGRAKTLMDNIGPSVGAYSQSQGVPYIRRKVAEFIAQRDGYASDPNNIFLTSGASAGVHTILNAIIEHNKVGVMIPIPQYPLYTASLALYDAKAVPYYLRETEDWGMSTADLENAVLKAREEQTQVRALVVINPGNPTGQCLSLENMQQIISFCKRERIVLMADEVYQTNIYAPKQRPFYSFKKVLRDMGREYEDFELISFHSVSKGMVGECGRRGGYFELAGIDADVVAQIYKSVSITLCPNVQGQIMVELMVNPPKEGEPSYELYTKEISDIYESLRRRSRMLCAAFNRLEGVSCNEAEGSMYLFPRIRLPEKAIEAAKEAGKEPDVFYCLQMLDNTGVCVVPGSGFGQEDGTWHFRSTFLPPEHLFEDFIKGINQFHTEFMTTYR